MAVSTVRVMTLNPPSTVKSSNCGGHVCLTKTRERETQRLQPQKGLYASVRLPAEKQVLFLVPDLSTIQAELPVHELAFHAPVVDHSFTKKR